MPKDINAVSLFGNAFRHELTYTPSGTPVLTMGVCGEEVVVNSQGKEMQIPFYMNTTVLGKPAEDFALELAEDGTTVVHISGELEHREWTDAQGVKQQRLFLRGENAQVVVDPEQLGFSQDAAGNKRYKGGHARAIVSGRVVSDASDLRTTKSGDFALSLRTNVRGRAVKNAEGKWESPANWLRMNLWRDDAKRASDLGIVKGNEFFAEGRLSVGQDWTDRDGNKRRGDIELTPVSVVWTKGRGSAGPSARAAAPSFEGSAEAFGQIDEDDAPF